MRQVGSGHYGGNRKSELRFTPEFGIIRIVKEELV